MWLHWSSNDDQAMTSGGAWGGTVLSSCDISHLQSRTSHFTDGQHSESLPATAPSRHRNLFWMFAVGAGGGRMCDSIFPATEFKRTMKGTHWLCCHGDHRRANHPALISGKWRIWLVFSPYLVLNVQGWTDTEGRLVWQEQPWLNFFSTQRCLFGHFQPQSNTEFISKRKWIRNRISITLCIPATVYVSSD